MCDRRIGAFVTAAVILLSGCTTATDDGANATTTSSVAASVTFDDGWASAADGGMTTVFGTFGNSSDRDARIVSGTSPSAAAVELHEVATDGGGRTVMRQKSGGIVVPAGAEKQLAPGGDHLMLMDLAEPLRPGDDVTVTVTFDDGSTLPITAQVRDFAGGNEEYAPSAHGHG